MAVKISRVEVSSPPGVDSSTTSAAAPSLVGLGDRVGEELGGHRMDDGVDAHPHHRRRGRRLRGHAGVLSERRDARASGTRSPATTRTAARERGGWAIRAPV